MVNRWVVVSPEERPWHKGVRDFLLEEHARIVAGPDDLVVRATIPIDPDKYDPDDYDDWDDDYEEEEPL